MERLYNQSDVIRIFGISKAPVYSYKKDGKVAYYEGTFQGKKAVYFNEENIIKIIDNINNVKAGRKEPLVDKEDGLIRLKALPEIPEANLKNLAVYNIPVHDQGCDTGREPVQGEIVTYESKDDTLLTYLKERYILLDAENKAHVHKIGELEAKISMLENRFMYKLINKAKELLAPKQNLLGSGDDGNNSNSETA